VSNFASPTLVWKTGYGLAFASYSAAMTFSVTAIFLRTANSPCRLFDALQPSAYGIYLVHYIFIIWLQYAVYDYSLPAFIKFAIVFAGTLSMSWGLTVALRKIPVVKRMI
jgi:surface polysaccharide O-acyltransferase-like enzyme